MKIAGFSLKKLPLDIITGIIIALVSIPISMGYAQVAGLPPVYGLYGSIFPILIFGLFSTSEQFIFGVDAAPAALVGAFIASKGIASGSEEAVRLVPMITLFVAVWLFVFFVMKAGRLVNYISTPVMGGFISGISTTIIFMQIPKVLGGTSGNGEIAELIAHIVRTCRESFNTMSLILGAASLALLLLSKKIVPKLPMSVFVMAGGAALGYFGFADRYGVAKLAAIRTGLPAWDFPHIDYDLLGDVVPTSLTIAVVIMAETLLASNNLANKNGCRLDENNEIMVYGMGNFAACLTGCCPVNGSVSRSAMGEQYGGASQVMSLAAAGTMAVIMMFFTGFIQYLPVPVLTAIVIAALLGAVEFGLAARLFRQDKRELLIFLGAFFGVLLFGTVYGVLIGVILSFVSVIINTANPKRSFLGVIPGHEGFHSLERNTYSIPLKNAVIYRFSGNLYFANIRIFISDIEGAVKEDTRCVVVDSGAICNIDITAADRISSLAKALKGRGVSLYFASHIGHLNDRMRGLGLGSLVEDGHCRRTVASALAAAGFKAPYALEADDVPEEKALPYGNADRLEFEWAFGDSAEAEMEKYTEKLLGSIGSEAVPPEQQLMDIISPKGSWKGVSELDSEELLAHLQLHIRELSEKLGIPEEKVAEAIERRRLRIAKRVAERDAKALERLKQHDMRFRESLKNDHPELSERLAELRRGAVERISAEDGSYADLIKELYGGEQSQ